MTFTLWMSVLVLSASIFASDKSCLHPTSDSGTELDVAAAFGCSSVVNISPLIPEGLIYVELGSLLETLLHTFLVYSF